jgi:hypothetical protein
MQGERLGAAGDAGFIAPSTSILSKSRLSWVLKVGSQGAWPYLNTMRYVLPYPARLAVDTQWRPQYALDAPLLQQPLV